MPPPQRRFCAIPLRAGAEYSEDRRAAPSHSDASSQLRQLSPNSLELGKLAKNDRLEIVRAERTRCPSRAPTCQHSNKGLELINFTRRIAGSQTTPHGFIGGPRRHLRPGRDEQNRFGL